MRQCISVLTVCMALLSTVGLRAEDPASKPLIDDSFEKGGNSPENWSQGQAVPGVKYVYDRAVASEGKRSLCLKKSAQRYFPIASWTRIAKHDGKGQALHVGVQVKAAKVTKSVVDVQFLDAEKQMLGHEWVVYIGQKEDKDPAATHDWKAYDGTVDIPENTQQIAIALQIYGPGDVWFDELKVAYVEPGQKPSDNVKEKPKKQERAAAEVPLPKEMATSSGGIARYLVIPPKNGTTQPTSGFPLLLVLPGGDGSADFHPFVRSIHELTLQGKYVVAQVVAPPQVVWPTKASTVRWNTTSESVAAIIDEMVKTQSVDRNQVYGLAWSSSGPAVYEMALQEKSPLAGAFIAMSVFKPNDLPTLTVARGRRFYLLHSPEDAMCPYAMAKNAKEQLSKAGAIVTLVDYAGGHGWHGPVHENLRKGIDWLTRR